MEVKDSGIRKQFDTGAVRDIQEGKGRCDLLPAAALLRLARHFEVGAVKYGDRNWEKGIPLKSFIDSGLRHLLKHMDGQTDEDHLCAAVWNLICAMWTEEKHPEPIDIPAPHSWINKDEIIEIKRSCQTCRYYKTNGGVPRCSAAKSCPTSKLELWQGVE